MGRFGVDPATIRPDFSVAPFTSNPLDYSSLHLQWTNPPSNDCAYLRLVRNPRNLPQDENDGFQVFDISDFADNPPDAPATTFGDPNDSIVTGTMRQITDLYLSTGFHYYSMFGWSTSGKAWIRCTDMIALVPINWGYGDRLYSLLPMAYRDQDFVLVDPYNPWPVDSPMPPLQRYLRLIGFQFDFIRTELESLLSVNDALNCSGALLPLMMNQLGLVHEPEMGMQQERQLVQNAIHLYKAKGSPRGIYEFTSILTSYPNTQLAHHGYNELLCLDDGVMMDGIGTWQTWPPAGSNILPPTQAAGQTLTWVPDLTPPCTDPRETFPIVGGSSTFPTLQPPYGGIDGNSPTGMRIQATGAGDLYATTGPIPITDFMSQGYGQGHITFTVQVWSSVSRQVYLSLWGDNGTGGTTGNPYQIAGPTQFTETAGHWTTMTLSGTINPYQYTTPGSPTPQGPASYYWVYPRIRIVGAAANEAHYITLCALWPCTPAQVGVETLVYEYPRDTKILLQPTATNLLSNTLTSFNRIDPNTGNPVRIGFDGLTSAIDPQHATANPTCALVYRPASIEDPTTLLPVHGSAALEIDTTGPGGTLWFGTLSSWSAPPPTPNGWLSVAGNWFPGAQQGPLPRPWFDPVFSWFMVNQYWFGVGSDWVNGVWFARPAQPTMNGSGDGTLHPFQVQAGQPFNFSVYAQYMTVQDPSNAQMQLGFRWYYPDGSWTESPIGGDTYPTYQIDAEYSRYSVAPEHGPFSLSDPPPETVTGTLPTSMYPFVRFPAAQLARFLLNAAMLSPGESLSPYIDGTSFSATSGDFITDPVTNASYVYPHRTPRIARLNAEMYRWLPMGSTYSITYASGAVTPPLDPTLWP